jgi:RNA polymerase sigma factor (TIGR02999 family)
MRQILTEYGRRRRRRLRLLQNDFGGRGASDTVTASESFVDLLDLDEALTALAPEYPEHARLVELRYFGGLSLRECAEELGVCERTVDRHWQFARAWLNRRLLGST